MDFRVRGNDNSKYRAMIQWTDRYASRIDRVIPSDVRELAKLMGQADIISFGGGIPDPARFPHERIAEAAARILGDSKSARVALQYSASGGSQHLALW